MKLIKTTVVSGVITVLKIASGFISTKVVAMVIGAGGVAIIGAFANFISIILAFANGSINTGVVKYTAELQEDRSKLASLLSTSLRISIICSAVVGVLCVVLSNPLSIWIFNVKGYEHIMMVLGISIIFYSLNSLLISIINGLGKINSYAIVNLVGSAASLSLTILLVFQYKVQGALYALILSQTVVFFISVFFLFRQSWFKLANFRQPFDRIFAMKLGSFSLMAIISALTIPVSQILVRNYIVDSYGLQEAGLWQGVMKISDGYLLVINTALGTYYLPKLSTLKTTAELNSEVLRGFKLLVPISLIMSATIYFLRFFIIKVLYTEEFYQMEGLFLWQLIGDFFKIASYILAYLMLAKAMAKKYIVTEVIFSGLYVLLCFYFLKFFAIRGVTMAFAVNYFLYFILMVIFFKDVLFLKAERR